MTDVSRMTAYHALIRGRVQGVGFRFFVEEHADRLGVRGYVRNLPGGRVEVLMEGSEAALDEMLARLRVGPSLAVVNEVQVEEVEYMGKFKDFRVLFW